MSDKIAHLGAKLRDMASHFGPEYLLDGTVEAIDSDAYTCDVVLDTDDGSTRYGCRLRSTMTGNSSIDVLPVVGSSVVIAKMGGEDYLVLACDEISSYRVTVGDMVFTVDQNGFGLSNGADSLKSILTDFVNGLLSVYAPKDVTSITALTERISALFQ